MVKERKWIIYMYTFPNGKKYIGKTSEKSLQDRQGGANWSSYRDSSIVKKAVKKYGVENIEQEILFEGVMTDEYASRLEMILIATFKTNCLKFSDPSYGYNMTDGGEGAPGYKHTSESKRRMSESKKQCSGDTANSSKPLYCFELDMVFSSGVHAEEATGVSRKAISWALYNKRDKNTSGGNTKFNELHWDFSDKKPRPKKKIVNGKPRVVKRNEVYCVELDKYFDSAQCASSFGYGSVNSIRACCNGNKAYAKANDGTIYHWLYAKDATEENILKKLKEDRFNVVIKNDGSIQKINKYSVYCIELDMYFSSPDDAERQGYGKKRNIMESYRGVRKFTKLLDGTQVHWLRARDVNEENIYNALNDMPWKTSSVEVYCIEQDKIYSSEIEADMQNNFPRGYVSRCINGYIPENRLKDGLHWEILKK